MDNPQKRRNTKNIGFNDEEYEAIMVAAKIAGLYPRQLIMKLIKGEK